MTKKLAVLLLLGVLVGICFISTGRLLAGSVSWGVRWIVSAIGWLILASVIIPVCDQIKKSREGEK